MEWINFEKNKMQECEITVFDDGNDKYKNIYNRWHIIATNNKGKYKIQNILNNDIIISISCWKLNTTCEVISDLF